MAKKLTSNKAKEILTDGEVHGYPLTDKQRKFFGAIAGGAPIKPKSNGWLNKFDDGGPIQENYNDASVSLPDGFVGMGYDTKGRNYSPAWGGQFQNGGFLQPTSPKLPKGYVIPYNTPSTELAMSIGGEEGEPAYLIPSFKGGKKLKDPIAEYKKTGEHLGGPFKTWQEAEKFGEMRHKYVEKGQDIPTPLKTWGDMAMGGSLPGAVGFTYARTAGSAPSEGPYAKKTLPSAQNGQDVQKQRYDELYAPIENKVFDAIGTSDNYLMLPSSTRNFLDKTIAGFSVASNRNIPPMDPIIKEVQEKVKKLPKEEISKLLKTDWSKIGMVGAMKNTPSSVSYLDMLKYVNHFNKLKKKGYTLQNGGEMRYYQNGLDWQPKMISKNGGWLSKFADGGEEKPLPKIGSKEAYELEKAKQNRSESTKVVSKTAPLTEKEKAKNKEINKGTHENSKEYWKKQLEERAAKIKDPGTFSKGNYTIEEPLRLFPNSEGGIGQAFDEYLNPAYFIGKMASNLGNAGSKAYNTGDFSSLPGAIAEPLIAGALGLDPLGSAMKVPGRVAQSMESGVLSNTYKLNPWAFKPNESNWYRQVGKSAIDDALETGVIREAGEEVSPRMLQEFQDQLVRMQGSGMDAALASRRPASPFFGKGELFYPMGRKPTISKVTGKLSKNPAGKGSADYLIETTLPNESFQPAYVKGMGLGVPTEAGATAILKPDPSLRNLENFNLYKKDWLRGYKEVPKPASISSSVGNIENSIINNTIENKNPLLSREDIINNISKDDPLFKGTFDEGHPYYSAEQPKYAQTGSKGDILDYDKTIDLIHDTYTKYPTLTEANYPLYFHGSTSASLPGFVTREGLSPLGTLMSEGQAPLSGEIMFGGTGINKDHISTVFLKDLENAVNYAKQSGTKIDPASQLLNWQKEGRNKFIKSSGKGELGEERLKLLDDLYTKRSAQWENMTDAEKQIAQENFPVMYGIRPKTTSSATERFTIPSSDIRGEMALKGHIGSDEIPSIFVPKSKMEFSKKFLGNNKINVLPLDDIITTMSGGTKPEWFKYKQGGVIKDDMGYWNPDNHGKIVEISSPDITMEGVDQPLLGISDTGDTKLMQPGENYKFKGKKVTEYPVAKNGVNQQDQKTLEQLDQLTNFTNYNKPQPGGWLNKYN